MKNKKVLKSKMVSVLFVVILIVVVGLISIPLNFNDHSYIITITDKERIVSDDSSKYLVFGDNVANNDSLVFENTDAFLRGKFDSSNIQGLLKKNHTYQITVVGYRIPFASMYENIIEVEEISK